MNFIEKAFIIMPESKKKSVSPFFSGLWTRKKVLLLLEATYKLVRSKMEKNKVCTLFPTAFHSTKKKVAWLQKYFPRLLSPRCLKWPFCRKVLARVIFQTYTITGRRAFLKAPEGFPRVAFNIFFFKCDLARSNFPLFAKVHAVNSQ